MQNFEKEEKKKKKENKKLVWKYGEKVPFH